MASKELEYVLGARLEYIIHGTSVFYCGISSVRDIPEASATTNAACEIINILAQAIGVPAKTLKFFELTTYTNWVFKPGEYDLHEVRVGPGGGVTLTRVKEVPEFVIEVFRRRIGGGVMRRHVPKHVIGFMNRFFGDF